MSRVRHGALHGSEPIQQVLRSVPFGQEIGHRNAIKLLGRRVRHNGEQEDVLSCHDGLLYNASSGVNVEDVCLPRDLQLLRGVKYGFQWEGAHVLK